MKSVGFHWLQAAFAVLTFLIVATSAGHAASGSYTASAVAAASGSSTPSPSPTPVILTQIPGANHVVYVLATAVRNDYDPTRDKVLAGFTQAMQSRIVKTDTQLVPMPDWSLGSFVQACEQTPKDPTYVIDGALIVRVYAVSFWVTHRTFEEAPTTAIDADAIYARCQPGDPYRKEVYTWHDDAQYKDGTVGNFNPTALSLILPIASLYEAFAPAKGQTTTTTKSYPEPSPLPPSTQVTTVTSSYNPNASSQTTTLATSLLASGLTYTQAVLNTPPPTNDRATWNAVNKLSAQMAADTRCTPKPDATGVPTPDALPGAEKAPFCP